MKSRSKSQQGVALFMSLVMLLILTVLGISSVQTTSLQQRMAQNARDANLSFQAAESALRDAEDEIETFLSINAFPPETAVATAASNGFYQMEDSGDAPTWQTIDWFETSGNYKLSSGVTGVFQQPRYIIEHVKTVISDADALNLDNIGQDTGSGRTQMFRITVHGTGGSQQAQTILQATYGKKL